MILKRLAFLLTVQVALCGQATAQEYAFRVLVNKGKNEMKSGDKWQQVKVGSSLRSADELKVSENAYLGLVHVSGKALEVKQAGKYKIIDLAAKVNGGATVLHKYTDFILSSNTNQKNNLAATGAVNRGDEITLNLPEAEKALIYSNEIIINWDTDKIPGPYIVKFNSMFEDELLKAETNENSIRLNLNDKNFENEDNILVHVVSKVDQNKQSKKYTLRKLSKSDRERIKSLLNEINDQTAEPTALNKLILAGFYEQNNLLIDAITAYQEAIRLAPDVPSYKEDYGAFLVRHKLK